MKGIQLAGRGGAVLSAMAITFGSVWLLSMLNAWALPSTPTPQPIRTVMIRNNSSDEYTQPTPEEPSEPPPPPEQMVMEFTPPTLDPLELEPLDLKYELPPPEIADARVRVFEPPQKPKPEPPKPTPQLKPVPKPQPSPKPAPKPKPAVYLAHKVDQPPSEVAGNPQPKYPAAEESQGIEANVLVQLLIDETGQVKDARVVNGAESFRKSVLAIVFKCRFKPAVHEGKAVKVWGVKQFQFKVRRRG